MIGYNFGKLHYSSNLSFKVAKEIILIRHSSLAVPRGVCYGFSNIDVSHNFVYEAEWLREKLQDFECDLVYCSSLQRCVKLAVEVFDSPIHATEGLKEVNYGEWEGKTWEEIDVKGDNLWMYENINNKPPNGESFLDLQKRVVKVLEEVFARSEERIAIVCHGGVIRSVLSHLLKSPLENTRSFHIHYAGFVKFICTNEGWRLSELNSGYPH